MVLVDGIAVSFDPLCHFFIASDLPFQQVRNHAWEKGLRSPDTAMKHPIVRTRSPNRRVSPNRRSPTAQGVPRPVRHPAEEEDYGAYSSPPVDPRTHYSMNTSITRVRRSRSNANGFAWRLTLFSPGLVVFRRSSAQRRITTWVTATRLYPSRGFPARARPSGERRPHHESEPLLLRGTAILTCLPPTPPRAPLRERATPRPAGRESELVDPTVAEAPPRTSGTRSTRSVTRSTRQPMISHSCRAVVAVVVGAGTGK